MEFIHIYQPPATPGGAILLLLHGTGGNEHDLVPGAELLLPGAGILTPRGDVRRGGAARRSPAATLVCPGAAPAPPAENVVAPALPPFSRGLGAAVFKRGGVKSREP